jgi:hypothetical protein
MEGTMEQKELAKQNSFKIIGELVECNLEEKTSTRSGKDFIAGKIVVKSILDGRQQLTEIDLFSNKFKQDGGSNKLYEIYTKLNSFLNKRIRVSGELGENRFFSTQNGQLVSTTVNRGRFIAAANTNEKDVAEFSFSGYVVKPIYERTNKDGDLINYEIVIGQANWDNTKPVYVKFTIDKENKGAVSAVQKLYDKGITVTVRGNIMVVTEDVEVVEQTAFGDSTRIYHNTYRNYMITTGSQPITDRGVYSPQDIVGFSRAYEDEGLSLEKAAKENADSGDTASTGKASAKTPRSSLL